MFSKLAAVIWALVLGLCLYVVSAKTYQQSIASYRVVEPPPLASVDNRLLSIVTLGFRGVYDDFLSIWSIQFLVDQRLKQYDPAEIFASVKTITRQGPKMESIYLLPCFVFAFDLKRPDYCKDIIIDGMNALPESWRLPMTQGFIYAFTLNQMSDAALFYSMAASRADAPPFLKKLAENFREKSQLSVEEMQRSLEQMFAAPGGSKMGGFLNDMMQRKREEEPVQSGN